MKSLVTRFYEADEKFGEVVKTELNVTYLEDFNKQGNLTEYEKKRTVNNTNPGRGSIILISILQP